MRFPSIFKQIPGLVAVQSTRAGGVSPAPYDSLNLGINTDDDPANVAENRRRFCSALGFEPDQLAWMRQVHKASVKLVQSGGESDGFDALISDKPGVLLAVSIADCAPILVYDQKNGAMAAIHAGWPGTAAHIVTAALQQMSDVFGTSGADCLAWVGACIDASSFEVGMEVAEQFPSDFKHFDMGRGKYCIDLKRANTAELLSFGLPPTAIEVSTESTMLHNDLYFSHRANKGKTGRMLAAIGRK